MGPDLLSVRRPVRRSPADATSLDQIEETVVPNFRRGLEEAGRSPEEADVTTEFAAHVGDPDDLVAEIRDRGEYIPDETELDNPDPRSVQAVANRQLSEVSDEELRDANTITDDPAEIVAKLERLEAAGVTRVLVGSAVGDPYRTIETFEEEVIPRFD